MDKTFPNIPVDAGMIVIADHNHFRRWGIEGGPAHNLSLEKGRHMVEWSIPDGWLERNEKPTRQLLEATSG